jgi:RimJ/RimL family protein N-acetyltransferase
MAPGPDEVVLGVWFEILGGRIPRLGTLVVVQLPYPEPDLCDGVVRLRRWEHRDVECVRLAATDTRIPQGTSVPAVFSPDEGIRFIERQWGRQLDGEGLSLAIAETAADEAVGVIVALLRWQPSVVGIGYWVVPPARGKRYAVRAVGLLVRWLLTQTTTTRVEALVEPDNLPSRRCLERSGFKEEGRLRLAIQGNHDALMYSLLGTDLSE